MPKRDEIARRPRVQLTLRVPARLGIELRLGGGELDVTNVGSVHVVEGVGPHPALPRSPAPSPASCGPGELEIDHAGSVAIETRAARSASPTSPARSRLEARRGDFRARGIGGAAHLEGARRRSRARGSRRSAPPHRLRRRGARPRRARRRSKPRRERTTLKLTPGTAVAISGDHRERRDRADAAPGGVLLDAHGDGRRHPHARRADRRYSATATTPPRSGRGARRRAARDAARRRAATLLSAEPDTIVARLTGGRASWQRAVRRDRARAGVRRRESATLALSASRRGHPFPPDRFLAHGSAARFAAARCATSTRSTTRTC